LVLSTSSNFSVILPILFVKLAKTPAIAVATLDTTSKLVLIYEDSKDSSHKKWHGSLNMLKLIKAFTYTSIIV
jgi:hypothetical protein